jgi:acyl-CoA synthetase (AMP-forming)/AMP-acid ligase II
MFTNIFEILTDSYSPCLVLPLLDSKIYYSSIRHSVEHIQLQPPFSNLKVGDIVTLALPNSVEFIITFFGIVSVRAVANPVKSSWKAVRLTEHIETVRPRLVITSKISANYETVLHVCKKLQIPLYEIHVELQAQKFRPPKIIRKISPIAKHHTATVRPIVHLIELVKSDLSQSNKPMKQRFHSDDLALLIHTHGTTGKSKIVPLTHANILDNIYTTSKEFGLQASDVCYLIMPLFHSHGLVGVLLSSFFSGSTVLLGLEMNMGHFWKEVVKYHVTWFSGTPLYHKKLLNFPRNTYQKKANLRFVQSCGTHLDSRLVMDLEVCLNVPVIASFTMTEASHLVTSTLPNHIRKLDSVGNVVGTTKVCLINEYGRKLLSGIGEICIKGPSVFSGNF